MKRSRCRSVINVVCYLAVAISLLVVTASTALAQGVPPSAAAPVFSDPKGQTHQRQDREALLRGVELKAAGERQNEQQIAAAVGQIKQDFKRVQLIRNEMVDSLLAKKPLDYKLISDQTREINKRANRLKTYMMPPAPGEKEKNPENQVEFNHEQMKGALVKLCNLIYSFTKNPALNNPKVVDVQQSNKFRADLQSIIELSSSIRKSAETLGKTSQ